MTWNLEPLQGMAYPGRGIILGLDPSGRRWTVAYFITGRSASSRARRLVSEGMAVWTKPTDPEILQKGNPDLLIYQAVAVRETGLAVSNGRQTADIADRIVPGASAGNVLESSLDTWDYEPDAPIFTPRISGCLTADGRAALSRISRAGSGATVREIFEFDFRPGQGALLTTYRGGDLDPISAFEGRPPDLRIGASSAAELAAAVDETLAPKSGTPDYRVSVVGLTAGRPGLTDLDLRIINRRE